MVQQHDDKIQNSCTLPCTLYLALYFALHFASPVSKFPLQVPSPAQSLVDLYDCSQTVVPSNIVNVPPNCGREKISDRSWNSENTSYLS